MATHKNSNWRTVAIVLGLYYTWSGFLLDLSKQLAFRMNWAYFFKACFLPMAHVDVIGKYSLNILQSEDIFQLWKKFRKKFPKKFPKKFLKIYYPTVVYTVATLSYIVVVPLSFILLQHCCNTGRFTCR